MQNDVATKHNGKWFIIAGVPFLITAIATFLKLFICCRVKCCFSYNCTFIIYAVILFASMICMLICAYLYVREKNAYEEKQAQHKRINELKESINEKKRTTVQMFYYCCKKCPKNCCSKNDKDKDKNKLN